MKKAIYTSLLILLSSSYIFSQSEKEEVFICFQPSPSFVGGMDSMYSFLRSNLTYPNVGCIEGKVYVSIDIDEFGDMTDIKIKRGLHPAFDNETIRVFKIMPKWIPAKDPKTGKSIKSTMVIPVKFKLE
jgi:TonB family protein